MSKLLIPGILQQQVNQQGGGTEEGVLYDGQMTVGKRQISVGYEYGFYDGYIGSINPTEAGFSKCNIVYEEDPMSGDTSTFFIADYPDIPTNDLSYYEFGGTVYTSAESLRSYLDSENENTITLKVYNSPQ